jgi:uncharacterized membrane protein YecN with MAPEG domain
MIFAFYTGLATIFFVFISIKVIKARRKYGFALGDGNNTHLKRFIRAHSNFIEYTPLFLICLFSLEFILHLHPIILHLLGSVFLFARIIHFYSVSEYEKYQNNKLISGIKLRIAGMMITFLVLISAGVLLIIKSILQF